MSVIKILGGAGMILAPVLAFRPVSVGIISGGGSFPAVTNRECPDSGGPVIVNENVSGVEWSSPCAHWETVPEQAEAPSTFIQGAI